MLSAEARNAATPPAPLPLPAWPGLRPWPFDPPPFGPLCRAMPDSSTAAISCRRQRFYPSGRLSVRSISTASRAINFANYDATESSALTYRRLFRGHLRRGSNLRFDSLSQLFGREDAHPGAQSQRHELRFVAAVELDVESLPTLRQSGLAPPSFG